MKIERTKNTLRNIVFGFCYRLLEMYKHKKSIFITIILLSLVLILCLSLYTSAYSLAITTYSLTSNNSISLRILQLTDLHNSEFGENNSRLLTVVRTQFPDLILLTGDLLNSNEQRTDIATNLITQLCEIAPVYCSNGNHEIEYQEKYGVDVDELYREAGAAVLEKEYQDITVDNQKIRIGGIYGYCLPGDTGEDRPEETTFLKDFQKTNLPTILMCHMPVCWMINGSLDAWDVDYVFSGHVHGGEVILPFIGGLYGPDFGWFPGRMEGIFTSEDNEKTLILSRGLGTSERIPRFNNIPEIIVVDIQGKD